MGIIIFGQISVSRDSADGSMPSEENNFLVAMNKLTEDYNNQAQYSQKLSSRIFLRICNVS